MTKGDNVGQWGWVMWWATAALRAARARHRNGPHEGRQIGYAMRMGYIVRRPDMVGSGRIWQCVATDLPDLVAPPMRPHG